MKNYKIKLGINLFILGLTGILSLLAIKVPMEDLPPEVTAQFSEAAFKWLILINPTALLIIAVIFGTVLHDRVGLRVPTIQTFIRGERANSIILSQLKSGFIGGAIAGVLLIVIEQAFKPVMSQFQELVTNLQLAPVTRLLYGGITEEILLRYGFMTIVVWVLYKITRTLSPFVYWVAILISSVCFAGTHLPIVFHAIADPAPIVIAYILLGNSMGGLIFGWIYWKKGLEASFVAHIVTHVVILIAGLVPTIN